MTRDDVWFFGSLACAVPVALAGIVYGIDKMVLKENDIKAVARIYRPGGCVLVEHVQQVENAVLLKCGDKFDVLIWR